MRDFGVYIHVPFCRVRCGYCDFNTYAPGEVEGATREGYVEAALAEMAFARGVMGGDPRPASTVFFGGGTPTMLDASALAALLDGVRDTWGLAADAEVTTEANPDSVTRESLAELAAAGFTRVSFGMQSAVPHVLATLERTHDPANVERAVAWAREAGLAVEPGPDLRHARASRSTTGRRASPRRSGCVPITSAPTRSSSSPAPRWARNCGAARFPRPTSTPRPTCTRRPTRPSRRRGTRGTRCPIGPRRPQQRCRHNMAYWRSHDWWGIGPGAHSYLGPRIGAERSRARRPGGGTSSTRSRTRIACAEGEDPAGGREDLDDDDLALERVMLRFATRGWAARRRPWRRDKADAIARLIADDVLDGASALRGLLVLTRRGRLVADAAVRDLT